MSEYTDAEMALELGNRWVARVGGLTVVSPDEYVPTEEDVRHYASTHGSMPAEWFDRWLAARDAARDRVVAERAWDEGNAARTQYEQAIVAAYVDDADGYIDAPENPYRAGVA